MPASQPAASERRNDRMATHEPPKLKTTLKTPPKQATNPLQFVKVGPCSLYRTAQDQLQKVQEVKKIKQEVRDDPEDWQSNLDNWKSSRRKHQEHIIERVVEVKKLELEEHDRQRRRSKTFSEMMEERGSRGRKLSIGLAVYSEEDTNDLSDLGIGTSSGKSSVSGDTHDDAHSVLSDRDSEIEKNHSDVDNHASENGNSVVSTTTLTMTATTTMTKKPGFGNGFHRNHNHSQQEYDSATTATASSPEPEEYTFEGAIRGYVSRVSQNIPRRSLVNLDSKLDNAKSNANGTNGPKSANEDTKGPVVKVDILKRREIFEKASSQKSVDAKANNRLSGDFTNAKLIKERLSNLEKQKNEADNVASAEKCHAKAQKRLSGDMSSIRERLSHLEKQTTERESKAAARKQSVEDLDMMRPLRERLTTLEKYSSNDEFSNAAATHEPQPARHNGELTAKTIKDRLNALDAAARCKETDKRPSAKRTTAGSAMCFRDAEPRIETSTPSERSSSPDSEYRVSRAAFHRSLDSLDADASSGPDTFERVQSLEELDYSRRYPASTSSAELLNDTDREDSGIHTADVSCSVSQADEPVDEEIVHAHERKEIVEEKPVESVPPSANEAPTTREPQRNESKKTTEESQPAALSETCASQAEEAVTKKGTADTSGELSTNKSHPQSIVEIANTNAPRSSSSTNRPVVYQSPRVPPRRTPPQVPTPKPKSPGTSGDDCASSKASVVSFALPEVAAKPPAMGIPVPLTPSSPKATPIGQPLEKPPPKSPSGINSPPALETMPKNSSPITPPASPPISPSESSRTVVFSSSNIVVPTSKTTPPTTPTNALPAVRSVSKIPTPLPRKTPANKPSSPSSPSSPGSPSTPLKLRITPATLQAPPTTPPSPSSAQPPMASASGTTSSPSSTEASSPTLSAASSTTASTVQSPPPAPSPRTLSPLASPGTPTLIPSPVSSKATTPTATPQGVAVGQKGRWADRRRTVVEVCEKVTVPQGEAPPTPPVTPFITVARVGDDLNAEEPNVGEIAVEESASREKSAATCSPEASQVPETATPMERAKVENENGSRDDQQQRAQEQKEKEEDREAIQEAPTPPGAPAMAMERPMTLTFGKSAPTTFDTVDTVLSPLSPMVKQILPLNLSSDEEIVSGLAFSLRPPTSVEPPKEKPPPPPVDLSDEESLPVEPLKRLNSTRRIKKELRNRRSDFLGIEGMNDDYLERELTLTKPPDMAAILAEERRIEQLHRRSYDTDSNYEQDSSHERDSGVELGHAEDWTKQAVSPDMSQHSRQSSEPFGASVTSSEDDEITKKEREIIEVLEREEQWRYGNDRELNSDIGEKLAHKLHKLEEEKMQLERERAQEIELRRQAETLRKNEENIRKQEEILRKQQEEVARQQEAARAAEVEARRAEETRQEELRLQAEKLRIQSELEEKERRAADVRRQEEMRIRAMENQIRDHENKSMGAGLSDREDEFASGEVLRVERELLQLEQEELKRQRSNLAYREQKQQQLAEQLQDQWKSMQDVAHAPAANNQPFKPHPPVNYRSSMPNLQLQDGQRRRPPPPPIPPAKPLRLVEQRQKNVTIRNSRTPSADSIPQQIDTSLRHSASATTLAVHAGQQMTRQTLQALSAAPRPRIVQGDQWVQRRKSDIPRAAQDVNYQHWLIQEAEQRRINEKNQRSPRKPQAHVTGTSVPYTASPPRSDSKPLPDSIIQTLTQRVQNRAQEKPLPPRRRLEHSASQEHIPPLQHQGQQHAIHQQKAQQSPAATSADSQEKMLSVSGKKKCSHCGDELGRGAAMIIESLRLFYHMECFKCCVCHVRLGDGLMGTDVRVRNHKLHCHNCYSSDDGVKFSCV